MHLLASNVQFDVKTGVLDIAHREIVTSTVKLTIGHLLWCAHKMYILHGTAITGFDNHRVDLIRHVNQRTRMANKVCRWHRQPARLGKSHSYRLIAYQSDGA